MKKQTQIFGPHFYTHLTELYDELEQIPVKSEINKNSNLYNGLYNLENGLPIDNTNWLNDLSVYKTDFGEA